jgi:hypothetical protein
MLRSRSPSPEVGRHLKNTKAVSQDIDQRVLRPYGVALATAIRLASTVIAL